MSLCRCQCGGPLIGFMHTGYSYSYSMRTSLPAETTLTPKDPAVALERPCSRGGLKLGQRTRPFARFISHSPSAFDHSAPDPPPIFLFLMSEPYLREQALFDLMHDQLNDAVALNLSTGLAYGTPPSHPSRFILVFFFHARHLNIHLA